MGWGCEDLVDLKGDVTFQTADGFAAGFAFDDAAGEVVAGGVVAGADIPAQAAQGDAVERGVGLSVTAAIESVAGDFARGCLLGTDAAQRGEGCLAAEPVGVVASDDEQGGGGVGADAAMGQQYGSVAGDRVGGRCSRSWISSVSCRRRRASNRRVYTAALVTS